MFDPNAFAATNQEEAEFDTTYTPIPVGEYNAVCESCEPKATPNGNGLLEVQWKIDDPSNDEANGRPVRQTVWLDTTESGGLDRGKGKNVQLGRLLEAVGLNGAAWNPGMVVGNVAKVSVKHRPDKEDPTILYAEVKSVAKAS